MKRYYYLIVLGFFVLAMNACKKEGELVIKPIRSGQPISYIGFITGDTLEQYFDGKKIRELYGRVVYGGRIIFDKEGPITMELKKKGDAKTLFSVNIEQGVTGNPPPITFFYDGMQVKKTYEYPDAKPGIEQVAFYFDFPADMPVDIVYGDISGDINAVQYLARNVKPKQWGEFMSIAPLDGGDLYIFLLKAGKKEYLINNNFEESYIACNLPTTGGWYQGGGVQSMFVRMYVNNDVKSIAAENLVDTFPK